MSSFAAPRREFLKYHRRAIHRLILRATLLTLASGLAFASASIWISQLAFDPQAIVRGDLWRLATGYFAHLSLFHAAANALGFGIATTMLLEVTKVRTICVAVTLIAVGIDTTLLLPSFRSYEGFAGFSGILYGLTALIACLLIGKANSWASAIALAILVSIVVSFFGLTPWNFEPATESHLVGLAFGGVFGFWLWYRAR